MKIMGEAACEQLPLKILPPDIANNWDDEVDIHGVPDGVLRQLIGQLKTGCAATNKCHPLHEFWPKS